MSGSSPDTHILLSEYEQAVAPTDRLPEKETTPVLLGLFGEVGSVMSTSKKLHREQNAFAGYLHDVEEELGDTLWYVAALCRRLNIKLSEVFAEVLDGDEYSISIAANTDPTHPVAQVITINDIAPLDSVLLRLGEQAAQLLKLDLNAGTVKPQLLGFIRVYIEAVQASCISFSAVLNGNICKTRGRFIQPSADDLPDFDAKFPQEEQLPRHFEIEISQRANGRSYLRWNGVFIGDPLSDNIADRDGYRFHDVFHFANAAILHWSPTFRALIKHKRKSKQAVEEAQDSGRAIVIDEGLSAYIFSYAKQLNFFDRHKTMSFDLLKAIRNFVRGYEVEACPLYQWESSILQGYDVFRDVLKHNGGVVIGNRDERTLRYKNIGERTV